MHVCIYVNTDLEEKCLLSSNWGALPGLSLSPVTHTFVQVPQSSRCGGTDSNYREGRSRRHGEKQNLVLLKLTKCFIQQMWHQLVWGMRTGKMELLTGEAPVACLAGATGPDARNRLGTPCHSPALSLPEPPASLLGGHEHPVWQRHKRLREESGLNTALSRLSSLSGSTPLQPSTQIRALFSQKDLESLTNLIL